MKGHDNDRELVGESNQLTTKPKSPLNFTEREKVSSLKCFTSNIDQ